MGARWEHQGLYVGSYRSKVGERVRPFLVTSVAVLVAMVKLVVRMVDFISQVSGLTSALYRHEVSHTNCTTE